MNSHKVMLIYSCASVFPSFDKWGIVMIVSYNGLWKLLIDKNMKKWIWFRKWESALVH